MEEQRDHMREEDAVYGCRAGKVRGDFSLCSPSSVCRDTHESREAQYFLDRIGQFSVRLST